MQYPFGQPPVGKEVWWRVEARRYSYVVNPDADIYGVTDPQLEAQWYEVLRHTPKGVRLVWGKFISLRSRKRWACPTLEEAIESFRARRRRQISILEARLARAKQELKLAGE